VATHRRRHQFLLPGRQRGADLGLSTVGDEVGRVAGLGRLVGGLVGGGQVQRVSGQAQVRARPGGMATERHRYADAGGYEHGGRPGQGSGARQPARRGDHAF
jgi:hypothetical protein